MGLLYRLALVLIVGFIGLDVQAQGLNRERGRYPAAAAGTLSDQGTVFYHVLPDSSYCSGSLCTNTQRPDSVRYTDASGATPTLTDPLIENNVAGAPQYIASDSDFNSLNVWRGASGDEWFSITTPTTLLSAPNTQIAVVRMDQDTANMWISNGDASCSADYNFHFRNDTDHEVRLKWGGTATTSSGGDWATATTYVATAIFDGASSKIRLNKSQIHTGTVGTGSLATWDFGNCNTGNPWIGEIAEWIVYSEALTDTEAANAECILSDKYSLGLSGC